MGLEQDIKQKKFNCEYEKATVNILYTAGWVESKNIKRLKPYGITSQQYNVLRILRGSHPKKLMLNDIACRMIDKNSNTTRLIDKLLKNQLVTRVQCEKNRRQVDIGITDKGLDVLTAIDAETEKWRNNFESLTKKECIELNKLLDKLRG
ncbi:MAG: MarR family transcriptional regulator [Bacteroidia bacterium]|nr:MarR family transcriptional regulator [Bacteroidia bacterium]MCZ2140394.1 MarR family transcriptional regulator [Bacteroidia bacterium]